MIEKQEKFCRMFQQIREKYYEADEEAFEALREAFEEAVAELKESRDSLHDFLHALSRSRGRAGRKSRHFPAMLSEDRHIPPYTPCDGPNKKGCDHGEFT